MEQVEQRLCDLREQITRLNCEKASLANEKQVLEQKISRINNTVKASGRMEQKKYAESMQAKNKYTEAKRVIEAKLSSLKRERMRIQDEEHRAWLEVGKGIPSKEKESKLVNELCVLREYYQEFAGDHTRVSSMRIMASEFSSTLDKLIKDHISGKLFLVNGDGATYAQ